MFVCPHCQFENPIQNRFCQRCGNALRELQAIILSTGAESQPLPEAVAAPTTAQRSPEAAKVLSAADEPSTVKVATLLTANYQLKGEVRYQLRHPQAAHQLLNPAETILPILDCEPATDSPLVQFLDNAPDDIEEADIDAMIPPMAFPYWKLQEQLYPVVPELQAAWQVGEYTITVLEDRSNWRTLFDLTNAGMVEPLEFVHWFYEMLTLWTTLAAFEAESSLLEPNNIRVDDDQVICLQRLVFNPSDSPPTLQTLGQFWQTWVEQLSIPAIPVMVDLVADMATGDISDPAIVKARLADIADQLPEAAPLSQSASSPTEVPIGTPTVSATLAMPAAESIPPTVNDLGIVSEVDETKPIEDMPAIAVNDLLLAAGLDSLEGLESIEEDGEEPNDDSGLADLPTMALPMKLYRLDEVGRTHVGRQRTHNEDSFFADTQLQRIDSPVGAYVKAQGLYILCDGMGGHSGGEVASHLAVMSLRDYFANHWQDDLPDDEVIKAGILQANQAIFDKNEAEARSGNARMGTTLVLVLVADRHVAVAHVGDSRLYCLNRNGLTQATVDHEVGQREINRGVEPAIAYARPDAYQLTQALGPRSNEEVAPTITRLTVNQDTLFILCSDGLSDNDLLETYAESYLEPLMRSKADLEEGVADLIDLANEHNGHDNITAIAVRFKLRPNLEATPEAETT